MKKGDIVEFVCYAYIIGFSVIWFALTMTAAVRELLK